jgi:hypothetical protein
MINSAFVAVAAAVLACVLLSKRLANSVLTAPMLISARPRRQAALARLVPADMAKGPATKKLQARGSA